MVELDGYVDRLLGMPIGVLNVADHFHNDGLDSSLEELHVISVGDTWTRAMRLMETTPGMDATGVHNDVFQQQDLFSRPGFQARADDDSHSSDSTGSMPVLVDRYHSDSSSDDDHSSTSQTRVIHDLIHVTESADVENHAADEVGGIDEDGYHLLLLEVMGILCNALSIDAIDVEMRTLSLLHSQLFCNSVESPETAGVDDYDSGDESVLSEDDIPHINVALAQVNEVTKMELSIPSKFL